MAFSSLALWVAPAWAQTCPAGPCADSATVVIEAPGAASEFVGPTPFEPAEQPTPVPLISVALGLLLLGGTLAHISLRRLSALRPAVVVAPTSEIVVIPAAQTYVAASPAVHRLVEQQPS